MCDAIRRSSIDLSSAGDEEEFGTRQCSDATGDPGGGEETGFPLGRLGNPVSLQAVQVA
jgi:hypothetical protein